MPSLTLHLLGLDRSTPCSFSPWTSAVLECPCTPASLCCPSWWSRPYITLTSHHFDIPPLFCPVQPVSQCHSCVPYSIALLIWPSLQQSPTICSSDVTPHSASLCYLLLPIAVTGPITVPGTLPISITLAVSPVCYNMQWCSLFL